ncbi:MAG: helix-turn-helix domain-containing protein [Myxococcales bacterium]|nr:helix-turn-helix domain-containing protein [Myxococcales bacterium]
MTPAELAELARLVSAQVLTHLDATWNRPAAVSLEEAARLLSCSPKHIGRLVKSGELRQVTIGSLRRIPMSEVLRLVSLPARERHEAPRPRPPAIPESVRLKAMLRTHSHAVPASAQGRG